MEQKVLIVEDDLFSRMLLIANLTKIGINNIMYTASGKDAVEIFKNNPDIDSIIMDIRIHDIDGYEATRLIREFNMEIVIIVHSAQTTTYNKEKVLASGFSDFLPKPFSCDMLKKILELSG